MISLFTYCWFYVKKWPFFMIFPFFRLFSPRWGDKKYFFDQKWLKHIMKTFLYIENTNINHKTVFGKICRSILHISGTRFIGFFLYFSENSKIDPINMVVTIDFRCRIYQNPFGSWPFGQHRSQIKKSWTLTIFFPLCSSIAPTICFSKSLKTEKVFIV